MQIKEGIYWVGEVDYNLRSFHRYSVSPSGTTYNAYLITDEKNVLVDCVCSNYLSHLINNINEIISIEKIDYIICNHLEPDHAGALAKIVELAKPEKIICSKMGLQSINGQFDTSNWNIVTVEEGETINIGKRNISFYETRMLHWPDSMVSYVHEDKVLFTNDIFGQNISSSYRYADECDKYYLECAVEDYYNNIVLPFSPMTIKALDKIKALNIPIDIIAPDHGLMFRTSEDINYIINKHYSLAEQKPPLKAVIVYDTMWSSTKNMAYAIAKGFEAENVPYSIMALSANHVSQVMSEIGRCGAVVLGSPTRNNTMLVEMVALLAHVEGLKPKNKIGAAFGSYGWSGEAGKHIVAKMEQMGIKSVVEPFQVKFSPKAEDLTKCMELGQSVAKQLKENVAKF